METVVDGTFSNTVVSRSLRTVVSGTYKLRNRRDKKGRYLESIWFGLPGEVCTDLMV